MARKNLRISPFEGIGLAASESSDISIVENKFMFLGTLASLESAIVKPKVIKVQTGEELVKSVIEIIENEKSNIRLAIMVSASLIPGLLPVFDKYYGKNINGPKPSASISLTVAIESFGSSALKSTGVLSFADAGYTVISPSTAQECFDYTQIANITASIIGAPVISYFDSDNLNFGAWFLANTTGPSKCITESFKKNREDFLKYNGDSSISRSQEMELIMKSYYRSSTTSYIGSPFAETVFVSISDYDIGVWLDNTSIGYLRIHVYSPLPTDAIIASLPKTVKRVVILEQESGLSEFHGHLFRDFQDIFKSQAFTDKIESAPLVTEVQSTYSIPIILSHPPYFFQFMENIAPLNVSSLVRLDQVLGFPDKETIEY
ncbi:hypothetical protein AYI68_g5376 [Smittium mucronatum]|uniref:Uncharacterized protein n=1 Tax=Smittium mucronatum TaxID=133383 RepID=A0A1R0GUF0_9FUNG|nr:hypothetical protein AYI68_g5376 [Smittium mucronatum]